MSFDYGLSHFLQVCTLEVTRGKHANITAVISDEAPSLLGAEGEQYQSEEQSIYSLMPRGVKQTQEPLTYNSTMEILISAAVMIVTVLCQLLGHPCLAIIIYIHAWYLICGGFLSSRLFSGRCVQIMPRGGFRIFRKGG